jgi:hypothetical protein
MAKNKSKHTTRLIITLFLIFTLLIFDVFLFKYRNYRKHYYKIVNKEKVVSGQPGQKMPEAKIELPVQKTPKVLPVQEKPVYASATSIKKSANEIPENFIKEIINEKSKANNKPAESEKPAYTIIHKEISNNTVNHPINVANKTRIIKGTVINAESSAPLSRVRVNAGLSTDEILTDMSGNFEISVDTAIKKIYFLCSGYEDKIMDVNNPDNTIALKKLIRTKNENLSPKKAISGASDFTIAVSDSDQGYRLYKAIEMAKQGDTVNALSELNELTILNKRNIAAWNEIIKITLSSNDKKAAMKGLKRLSACVSTEKLKNNISKILKLTEQEKYSEALLELKKLKLERQY